MIYDIVCFITLIMPSLTHYQTTNFRLFQTKEFANDNFKLDENCRKFSNGLKTLWEKEKLLIMSKTKTKQAEFGYPVTKFISPDARHITTVHQTGVSVRFVPWKVLNMIKTSNLTKWTSPDITRQEADSPDKKRT